jgi:hypothetical protein
MSFSDSDWTLEAAAAPPVRKPASLALAVTFGVVVGAALASLVWLSFDARRAHVPRLSAVSAASGPARAVPLPASIPNAAASRIAPASAAGAQAVEGAAPSMPAPASAPSAAVAASATSGAAIVARATTGASAPREARETRKEQLWARHYRRPAQCEGNPTPQQMIDCANDYIRERRRFDADYAAGRL